PRFAPFAAGSSQFLGEVAGLRTRFLECMDDDFNTGGAVGVLHYLLNRLNSFIVQKDMDPKGPLDTGGLGIAKQIQEQANIAFPENVRVLKLAVRVLKELS